MKLLIAFLAIFSVLMVTAPQPAYAACAADPNTKAVQNNSSADKVLDGVKQTGTAKCNDRPIKKTLRGVISIIALLAGIIAIIAVIIAGFRFITSNGDPQKAAAARSALVAAIIGIAIAALAQILVHFALNASSGP